MTFADLFLSGDSWSYSFQVIDDFEESFVKKDNLIIDISVDKNNTMNNHYN